MNEQKPPRSPEQYRQGIVLAIFTCALCLLPLLVKVAPLQDQMDWVMQAKIIADPDNPAFAEKYLVQWQPVPNLLGTALIALLARLLPIFSAAGAAYALYLAGFVAAFVYLVRSDGQRRPLVELAGVLYAMNHFFLMGFFNFALGLVLAFLALGWLRRHLPGAKAKTWLVFCLLTTLTYLSHFLPFAVLALGSLVICTRAYRRKWKHYWPWLASLAPALGGLAWYSQSRAGEFFYHYAFHNALYYLWYKVGPWAVASNYYPLTPAWAAWVNVAINLAVISGIIALIALALGRRWFDLSSPLFWTAAALALIALVLPTRIFELLRPGQRLLFASVLLLAASTKARPISNRFYHWAIVVLAALLLWNGAWWLYATDQTDRQLAVLEKHVTDTERLLLLADSHFHYREPRSYGEKLADPFSYPNSVNPLRYLAYVQAIEGDGAIRSLFGTGIVHSRGRNLLPAVNRPWHLSNPESAGRYSHLVATGKNENLADIADRAGALFQPVYQGRYLLIMNKRQ